MGFQINSGVNYPPNQWYHVAMAYNGTNTLTLYVNGISQGTFSVTPSNMAASTKVTDIGSYATTQNFHGYITNVRVVKGVAVYTGDFTVPAGPLTATQSASTNISAITGTQTQLLLNSATTPGITDSSTYNLTASYPNGQPSWSMQAPFHGATQSNYGCIARVGYQSGNYINMIVIDQADTGWQSGSTAGPALAGTFTLPVTFTSYLPPTQL